MTIKSIVVPLTGIAEAKNVVAVALNLARHFDAALTGYDAVPEPELFVDQGAFGTMAAGYEEIYKINLKLANDRRIAAKRMFEAACKSAALPVSARLNSKGTSAAWSSTEKIASGDIFMLMRCADLIVSKLPSQEHQFADLDLLEKCVFATGQPVLAVPQGGGTTFSGRTAIAWNGSVEAMRAVKGALPLLQLGKGVEIIQVGDVPTADAELLAIYLGRHGIKAKIQNLKDQKRRTGQLIFNAATDANCELLVMGAYTHSPMREFILGGVTRYMFDNANIPVLLAH